MKKFVILILCYYAPNIIVMANPEEVSIEILEVEIIPSTSAEYPFVRTVGLERENNIISLELDSDPNNLASSPILLLPEGMTCIQRNALKLDKEIDLVWLHDLFENYQKEDNNLLESSKIHGDFIVRFNDLDLLISFYERSDKVVFMTAVKMELTILRKNNTYFIGFFPSSSDDHLWRRTNDEKVSELAKLLSSHVTVKQKPQSLPEK